MRVLIGAPIRQTASILSAYLQTIEWQVVPKDVEVEYLFVDDCIEPEAKKLLSDFRTMVAPPDDGVSYEKRPDTTQWSVEAFQRVAQMRQNILDYAVDHHYDAVFMCDSDLLLDPMTLSSLLGTHRPIVAAVFWTKWQPRAPAQPQVWLRHPYELQGRGMDQFEFRRKLSERQLTKVYGLGACMLVHVDALKKGVRYYPLLPELVEAARQTGQGMFAGEDRTFCTHAERLHVDMWADPWPDIFHVYRPQDVEKIPEFMSELALRKRVQPLYPEFGDDVNLQLLPLEDPHIGPQTVRGRLGALRLLPAVESAVRSLRRGGRKLVSVYFPVDWPLPATGHPQQSPPLVPYRGTKKVIEVELVDHKPHGYPPVLRDEFVQEDYTFRDRFSYSPEQNEALMHARRT